MVLQTLVRAVVNFAEAVEDLRSVVEADGLNNLAKRTRENFREDRIRFTTPDGEEDEEVEGNALKSDIQEGVSDLVGEFPEEATELIIEQAPPEEIDDDEDIREVVQGIQGAALTEALLSVAGSLGIEIAGLTQVESHQVIVSQVLAAGGIDSLLGLEVETTVSEGVQPRLEQQINSEYRTKQVNLQDVVEQSLRNKDSDTDYLQDISTYGIKPEEESILEEVALNAMEFEELIETPAELGLIVPDEILQAELDRSGYAEPTKDFLNQVNNRITRSARAYQELIVSEDLISDLDTRVEDGTLTPDEAIDLIPDEVNVDEDALRRRFTDKRDLDPQAPSRAQILGSLTEGYSDLGTASERLDIAELDTERYPDVLRSEIVGDLDGSLQEAVATGRLSETEYANLAEFAGFDDDVIDALLDGQSFSDLVDERLPLNQRPQDRSVETIVDIGGARTRGLENAGIGTVGALADADPEVVAEAAAVNDELAQTVIERAQRRLGRR